MELASTPAPTGHAISVRAFQQLYLSLKARAGSEKLERSIQFVAPIADSGTSMIARDFALVAASQEPKPVLLADFAGKGSRQAAYFAEYFGWDRAVQKTAEWNGGAMPPRGPWASSRIGESGIMQANFGYRWIFKNRFAVSETTAAGDELPALDPFALRDFWQNLHKVFGLIVVDCSARNESANCLALAPYMDASVMVLSADDTRVPVARRLRDELTDAGGQIPGVVLNKRRFHIPKFIYRRLGG